MQRETCEFCATKLTKRQIRNHIDWCTACAINVGRVMAGKPWVPLFKNCKPKPAALRGETLPTPPLALLLAAFQSESHKKQANHKGNKANGTR